MIKAEYIVLDLETTGLSPQDDAILEVGAIAIDADFNVLSRFESLVKPKHLNMNAFVLAMHAKNGLSAELQLKAEALLPLAEVDADLANWFISLKCDLGDVVLVGNSIAFDVSFIKAQMPRTATYLHYRTLDLSAIARFFKASGVALPEQDEVAHRSMPDCEQELIAAKAMRSLLQQINTAAVAA